MSHITTLQSWKEIAEYLRRAVRTVQRWEELGLPIHRLQPNSRKSAVYAITHELDTWLLNNPQDRTPGPTTDEGRNGHRGYPVALKTVLITDQLALRPAGVAHENGHLAALRSLGKEITSPPEILLSVLVHQALELCGAESAGLSLLHEEDKKQFFHWDALAGLLKDCGGQTTPRACSPCGVTLDRRSPQLFSYPERYFDCLKTAPYPIVEGLVIPVLVNGDGLGTIWIVSHRESLTFNSQHVATMMSLAALCEAALSCTRRRGRQAKTPNRDTKSESPNRINRRMKEESAGRAGELPLD